MTGKLARIELKLLTDLNWFDLNSEIEMASAALNHSEDDLIGPVWLYFNVLLEISRFSL